MDVCDQARLPIQISLHRFLNGVATLVRLVPDIGGVLFPTRVYPHLDGIAGSLSSLRSTNQHRYGPRGELSHITRGYPGKHTLW